MSLKPINFNAGPAALPGSVLSKVNEELFNWRNTGVSIMELGHRTHEFSALNDNLNASVRRILNIPDHFAVLFLPGGAQIQFSTMVMNLIGDFDCVNYLETGYWSTTAIKAAQKYTHVHIAASSSQQGFLTIPESTSWNIKHDAAFLHFTDNETINGVEFAQIPDLDNMILVSDMSSNIFSRPIDFTRMGCIYACAQKNFGIAGMTLVIVRRDLFDRAHPLTPSIFNFALQDQNKSLLATPPTVAMYIASLVLDWLETEGGLNAIEQRNKDKANLLYDYLDASEFYINPIDKTCRSRMNIPFRLIQGEKETDFFHEAERHGLLYLQGHRSVGGVRASIYNAITLADVNRLIEFLDFFATR